MGPLVHVIGETVSDHLSRPGARPVVRLGGSPATMARWLARAGLRPTLSTLLGTDVVGRQARQILTADGVILHPSRSGLASTPTVQIDLDADGHPTYHAHVEWTWSPSQPIRPPQLLLIASLGAWKEPGCHAVLQVAHEARQAGSLVAYDLNARPSLMDPLSSRQAVEHALDLAHFVKASDEDLQWYAPRSTPCQIAASWLARGVVAVAITRGAQGATLFLPRRSWDVSALPTVVHDTVGAGDAWMSGAMIALLNSTSRTGSDTPDLVQRLAHPAHLDAAARLGSHCARWCVARPGAAFAPTAAIGRGLRGVQANAATPPGRATRGGDLDPHALATG